MTAGVRPQAIDAIRKISECNAHGMIRGVDALNLLNAPESHVGTKQVEGGLIDSELAIARAKQIPIARRGRQRARVSRWQAENTFAPTLHDPPNGNAVGDPMPINDTKPTYFIAIDQKRAVGRFFRIVIGSIQLIAQIRRQIRARSKNANRISA